MVDKELFGNSEQLDTISRRSVIKEIDELLQTAKGESEHDLKMLRRVIKDMLPSAQPDLSEAYSKAVFTWLMNYQIRTAELKGRYTPYEVLSWVINDWRKENG